MGRRWSPSYRDCPFISNGHLVPSNHHLWNIPYILYIFNLIGLQMESCARERESVLHVNRRSGKSCIEKSRDSSSPVYDKKPNQSSRARLANTSVARDLYTITYNQKHMYLSNSSSPNHRLVTHLAGSKCSRSWIYLCFKYSSVLSIF